MKRFFLVLLVLAICGTAIAADPAATAATAVTGKITAVEDGKVTIAIDGDKPAWVKKNAPVKFRDGVGKVLAVSDDPLSITVKTRKAGSMSVGDTITFQKGKAMSGC
ncbi:MAG: hypothetical protein ABR524_05755 [Thermoanaerobaculia bacterium]